MALVVKLIFRHHLSENGAHFICRAGFESFDVLVKVVLQMLKSGRMGNEYPWSEELESLAEGNNIGNLCKMPVLLAENRPVMSKLIR